MQVGLPVTKKHKHDEKL